MCGECRAFPYAWKLSPISPGSTNGRPHLPWTLAQPSSMCSFATWRISPSCLTVSEVSTRRQKLYSLLWTTKRCDVSRYDSSGSTQLRILEWLTRALFADGSGGEASCPLGLMLVGIALVLPASEGTGVCRSRCCGLVDGMHHLMLVGIKWCMPGRGVIIRLSLRRILSSQP